MPAALMARMCGHDAPFNAK
jgi:DNA-binding transcriptional LysR family regulator